MWGGCRSLPGASMCTPTPPRGATGQETPGLERMHKEPGSGLASATTALRGAGPEKPGSQGWRREATWELGGSGVRAPVSRACQWRGVWEKAPWVRAHGCHPVAAWETAGASNRTPKCFLCRGTEDSPHRQKTIDNASLSQAGTRRPLDAELPGELIQMDRGTGPRRARQIDRLPAASALRQMTVRARSDLFIGSIYSWNSGGRSPRGLLVGGLVEGLVGTVSGGSFSSGLGCQRSVGVTALVPPLTGALVERWWV